MVEMLKLLEFYMDDMQWRDVILIVYGESGSRRKRIYDEGWP